MARSGEPNLLSAEGREARRKVLAAREQRDREYVEALRRRLAKGKGWSQGARSKQGPL